MLACQNALTVKYMCAVATSLSSAEIFHKLVIIWCQATLQLINIISYESIVETTTELLHDKNCKVHATTCMLNRLNKFTKSIEKTISVSRPQPPLATLYQCSQYTMYQQHKLRYALRIKNECIFIVNVYIPLSFNAVTFKQFVFFTITAH